MDGCGVASEDGGSFYLEIAKEGLEEVGFSFGGHICEGVFGGVFGGAFEECSGRGAKFSMMECSFGEGTLEGKCRG